MALWSIQKYSLRGRLRGQEQRIKISENLLMMMNIKSPIVSTLQNRFEIYFFCHFLGLRASFIRFSATSSRFFYGKSILCWRRLFDWNICTFFENGHRPVGEAQAMPRWPRELERVRRCQLSHSQACTSRRAPHVSTQIDPQRILIFLLFVSLIPFNWIWIYSTWASDKCSS